MKMYNVVELAELFKKSKIFVLRQLRTGALRGAKLGRDWRVRESDLELYLDGLFERADETQAA